MEKLGWFCDTLPWISKGNVQSLNDQLPAMGLIPTLTDTVMKSFRGRKEEQICNIFCNITRMSQECLGTKCKHLALGLLFHNCSLHRFLPFILRCPFVSIAINRALEPDGPIGSPFTGKTRAQHLAFY